MGLVLALTASLLWGCSDFLGAFQSRRLPVFVVMGGMQGFGILPVLVLLTVQPQPVPPPEQLAIAALAGICGAGGVALMYPLMAAGAMILIAPIAALTATVPVIVGVAQGEHLGPLHVLGILAALVGATLASWAVSAREAERETRLLNAKTVGAMLGSVALTGAFFVLMRYGSVTSPGIGTVTARGAACSAALIATAVWAWRRRTAHVTTGSGLKLWLLLVATGIVDGIASTSYATATTHGASGVVAVLASLYPAVTVLLAVGFLGERLRWHQIVGLVLAVAGVALLA